jgi:hypothetical protein
MPTPTEDSTPAPASASRGSSLQALIDATPSGGMLRLSSCTYYEAVTIDKPLTVIG